MSECTCLVPIPGADALCPLHGDPRDTNVVRLRLPRRERKFLVTFNAPVIIHGRDSQDVLRALDFAGIQVADVRIDPL